MMMRDTLRFLRKRMGLSQDNLAIRLNRTQQAISKWECGESEPDSQSLCAMADLYGVTVDYIVGHKSNCSCLPPAPPENEAVAEFQRITNDLNRAQISFLLGIMEAASRRKEMSMIG